MKIQRVLSALLLGLAAGPVLACYTVYDRSGRVVYNVPYTLLAGGIALVQAGDARAAPGVTVVPAQALAAVPAVSRDTVITELREPPTTIVQSGNQTVVSEMR